MANFWPDVRGRLAGAAALGARALANRLEKARVERQDAAPGGRREESASSDRGPDRKPERPRRSLLADPYGLTATFGYKDRASQISYNTLRELVYRVPVVSNIIQVRTEQVASFGHVAPDRYSLGFRVKLRDAKETSTRTSEALCRQCEQFILRTGVTDRPQDRDSFETYLRKIVRDALIFDQNCTEVVPANDGRPAAFYAVDAANIRIASKLRQYMRMDGVSEDAAYVEVWQESIRNTFTRQEMIFGVRNPSTDIRLNGYGTSELEYLLTTITQMLNAFNYNSNVFENGTMARGLLNIKDPDISAKDMNKFVEHWDAMLRGVENAHRIPVVNSAQGVDYINLQGITDTGYQTWMDYLIKCTCFPADTPVTLADGREQKISEISPGQSVLTHMGRGRKVLNKQTREYHGKLICLRFSGRTVKCTPEHPFYIRSSRVNAYMMREHDDPRWETAENLVAGSDHVLVPKPRRPDAPVSEVIDLRNYLEPGDFVENDGRIKPTKSHRNVAVSAVIPLTKDACFVWGLYAAEGNANKANISWSFHASEQSYVDAVKKFVDSIGLNFVQQEMSDNCVQAKCASGIFVKALRSMWGERQSERRVPREIIHASDESIEAFLSGLVAGDGCVCEYSSTGFISVEVASCSEPFLRQVQNLFARLGIWSTVYHCQRGVSPGSFSLELFSLRVGAQYIPRVASWLSGEKGGKLSRLLAEKIEKRGTKTLFSRRMLDTPAYFCLPVHEIWEEKFDGVVHNMEVEGDNTYLAAGVSVHNCAAYKISPEEIQLQFGNIGQTSTLSESNNRDKIIDSKERGLRPLLRHISGNINRHLIWPISEAVEFEFVGLDAMSPEERIDFNTKRVRSLNTLNEIRAEHDLPPLPGGDTLLDGAYMQAVNMAQQVQGGQSGDWMTTENVADEGQPDAQDESPSTPSIRLPSALEPYAQEFSAPNEGGPTGVGRQFVTLEKAAPKPRGMSAIELDIKL